MKKIIILVLTLLCIWPVYSYAQKIRSTMDSDEDGLPDNQENFIYYTDPNNPDTDQDGYTDGTEIENRYSPRHGNGTKLKDVDSDNDYLSDAWELILNTGIMNPDSDNDSYLDGTEVAAGYDPLDPLPLKKEKFVDVNLTQQRLTYFFDGKKLDSFLISGGLQYMPTPEGEFTILEKVPVKHYGGGDFDFPNTKWNLHFTTQKYRYYIHGAYWHNNFGHPMSHGCINVSYDDMEQLYNWAQTGTKVSIHK